MNLSHVQQENEHEENKEQAAKPDTEPKGKKNLLKPVQQQKAKVIKETPHFFEGIVSGNR